MFYKKVFKDKKLRQILFFLQLYKKEALGADGFLGILRNFKTLFLQNTTGGCLWSFIHVNRYSNRSGSEDYFSSVDVKANTLKIYVLQRNKPKEYNRKIVFTLKYKKQICADVFWESVYITCVYTNQTCYNRKTLFIKYAKVVLWYDWRSKNLLLKSNL